MRIGTTYIILKDDVNDCADEGMMRAGQGIFIWTHTHAYFKIQQ